MAWGRIFERKSETVMFLAGLLLLINVAAVMATGDFVFWKIVKLLYALGVVLIIFDR